MTISSRFAAEIGLLRHGAAGHSWKFEKVNLKFEKVRKSSRSTCDHDCYRKTLSILNIATLLNFMQYNAVQQGSDYTA